MREIKFRAWDKILKRMWYLGLMNREGIDTSVCEVMQYVGIDDENRKEIYEGDIVQYDTEDGIVTAQIVFKIDDNEDAHISGFYTEFIRIEDYPEDLSDMPVYFTVIGNIYENPGLLESKNGTNTTK
jgi:uncharacterized phage protein (TIGR01671 family)